MAALNLHLPRFRRPGPRRTLKERAKALASTTAKVLRFPGCRRPPESSPAPRVVGSLALVQEHSHSTEFGGGGGGAPDRETLEAYASWLFYERRLLCRELYPHLGAKADTFVLENAGSGWHFALDLDEGTKEDRLSPSARALAVLDMVGVDLDGYRGPELEIFDTGERPPLPGYWPHADAEILSAADKIAAIDKAYAELLRRVGEDAPGLEELEDERQELVDTITSVSARSVEGMSAKAKVLKATLRVDHDHQGALTKSLIDDIDRLASLAPHERAASGAEEDEELLGLVHEWRRLHDAYRQASRAAAREGSSNTPEQERLFAALGPIGVRIARSRVKTFAGLLAKAQIAEADLLMGPDAEGELEQALRRNLPTPICIGLSLVVDVLQMKGGQG